MNSSEVAGLLGQLTSDWKPVAGLSSQELKTARRALAASILRAEAFQRFTPPANPPKQSSVVAPALSSELHSLAEHVAGEGRPVIVAGEAYLAGGPEEAAATEFLKILDHLGLDQNCPTGALANLGLARAYALEKDTAKARAAYQDFLMLWNDADSDIPILQQAKAEFAAPK